MVEFLLQNEIFVFGSNTEGRHGAGAAKTAMGWGAEYGKNSGRQGQTCLAVSTKARRLSPQCQCWAAKTMPAHRQGYAYAVTLRGRTSIHHKSESGTAKLTAILVMKIRRRAALAD